MNQEFIYNNSRICGKLYVFFKFIGLIFYSTTLLTCYNPDFYIGIVVAMFLSMINSVRYEYAHFKRYGTTFSSLNEYKIWKKELWPKSKIFFSTIELSIKTAYFIRTFPPIFNYRNLCEIGESILKIHILLLFALYIIFGIFSIFILWIVFFLPISTRLREPVSLLIPNILNTNQNEECCICLDMDNNIAWSILPCGHKFHWQCVSIWIRSNQTCPVCRYRVIPIS
jgi:hypothetical protein